MDLGSYAHMILLLGLWSVWEIIKYLGKKGF
jgi:hypothetical protein